MLAMVVPLSLLLAGWGNKLNASDPQYRGFVLYINAGCWLVTGVLVYARVYNAADTYDPPWLHIFG